MAEQELPSKKDVGRALLLRGSVFVHMDPRREEVEVPPWLKDQPQLVLQVGLDMPVPIPDLRIDDKGVFGTLSFNRAPFTCRVPWKHVFALVGEDGRGMVWPEDLPDEIAHEVDREFGRHDPELSNQDSQETPTPRSPLASPHVANPAAAPLEAPQPTPGGALQVFEGEGQQAPSDKPSSDHPDEHTAPLMRKPTTPKGKALPPYLRVVK